MVRRMRQKKKTPSFPSLPPSSIYYEINSLHFVPKSVHIAAITILKGEKLTDEEGRWSIDDYGPVRTFLNTVGTDGDLPGIKNLVGLLRVYPTILSHPYVWDVLRFLNSIASPHQELNEFAQNLLASLISAWTEGMSGGTLVAVENQASGGPGRAIQLFPKLKDTKGWFLTYDSLNDRRRAVQFIDAYEDLQKRLKVCGGYGWKDLANQFRLKPGSTVDMVAEDVGRIFENYKLDRALDGKILNPGELKALVEKGLEETRKRQSLRHEIVCQLLATLCWEGFPTTSKPLDSTMIDETLSTLKKHFSKDWFQDFRKLHGYS